MLLLGNIGYDFSPMRTSHVLVTNIPSNWGDTFFMSVRDLTGIETWEEIL